MNESERVMIAQEHLECSEIFTEPFSGDLYDRTYSAVPANPYVNDGVKERQQLIKVEFAKLFEHPPKDLEVPDSFRDLLVDDYYINVERQRMFNYTNFTPWRQDNPRVHEALEPAVRRTERGFAEIGDVLDVATGTDVGGLEVGRVTHPYWQRIEHTSNLEFATAAAIVERGGQLEPVDTPYRRIKIAPHTEEGTQNITGFVVRYKRNIGSIPKSEGKAVKIVERKVVGFRVDEASGFPQDIIEAMNQRAIRETNIDPRRPFDWKNTTDDRFRDALADTRCRGFIERCIQHGVDGGDFIVPESTAVFCYTESVPLDRPSVPGKIAKIAIRRPDSDDKIAFFNSNNS